MTSSQAAERYLFRALWPVVSPEACHALADLFSEAANDLPQLARRHHALLLGQPRWSLQPGRQVPGSAGAPFILLCDAGALIDPMKGPAGVRIQ